jgi:hypothetical protein
MKTQRRPSRLAKAGNAEMRTNVRTQQGERGHFWVGTVCLCLSVFGMACVGDGTFARYFQRMTKVPCRPELALPHLEAMSWEIGFTRPRLVSPIFYRLSTSLVLLLLLTPWSSAGVESDWPGIQSCESPRLDAAEHWMSLVASECRL